MAKVCKWYFRNITRLRINLYTAEDYNKLIKNLDNETLTKQLDRLYY